MSTRNSPLVARRARSGAAAILASLALIASLFVASPAVAAEPVAATAPVSAASAPGVSTGIVKAAPVVGFDPENIISDALFYDGGAMTAAEIQSFLDSKIGRCENGKCLNVINASISDKAEWVSQTTGQLVCSAIKGGTMKASELIYRMQTACGISAKVILVTLQKEQGLVTSTAPSDWNLQAAMGASCPDTAPCDPSFKGVGPQIFKGTQQLKTYKATRFARQPGVHFIGWSPNSACGGTNLNIRNYATAALYNYTPYQPNAAALNAGYGLGDGCSSYGNRNFYNYYTAWFGSTQVDATNNPIGRVELMESRLGGFRVSGWALDPNTDSPIQIHVYVDEVSFGATADLSRPDVASLYGGNSQRGFAVDVPARQYGTARVCVYAINVGPGDHTVLGCRDLPSRGGSPLGSVDAVAGVEGGVKVSGWALDPDILTPTSVHIYVDGVGVAIAAGEARPDIASAYAGYGANHGFSAFVEAPPGLREVCVYAINVGVGETVRLSCRSVTVPGEPDLGRVPFGSFEAVALAGGSATVSGWAIDPDTVKPIMVHIYVNGVGQAFAADGERADVGAVYPAYGRSHGFSEKVSLKPGANQVCVFAINAGRGNHTDLGCRTVEVPDPDQGRSPFGAFESLTASGLVGTVGGWAIDPDTAEPIAVHVYVNGVSAGYKADKPRADVGRVYPASGANHGFAEQVTLRPGHNEVCVWAINNGRGAHISLGCRAIDAT